MTTRSKSSSERGWSLVPRMGSLEQATPADLEAGSRIATIMTDLGDTPTLSLARASGRLRHIQGFGDLTRELDALDRFNLEWTSGARYDARGVRIALLLRFLERSVERAGWYPAKYYENYFGIKPAALRQRVRRHQLSNRREGQAVLYPFAGVAACFPHLVDPANPV